MRRSFWLLPLMLLVSPMAHAQTVITPTNILAFTASADQNTVDNGVPRLTNYAIAFCPAAQVTGGTLCAAPQVVSVGKPTPDGSNTIATPTIRSLVGPNAVWVAFLQAVGPGGTTTATGSVGPFTWPAPPAAGSGLSIR